MTRKDPDIAINDGSCGVDRIQDGLAVENDGIKTYRGLGDRVEVELELTLTDRGRKCGPWISTKVKREVYITKTNDQFARLLFESSFFTEHDDRDLAPRCNEIFRVGEGDRAEYYFWGRDSNDGNNFLKNFTTGKIIDIKLEVPEPKKVVLLKKKK